MIPNGPMVSTTLVLSTLLAGCASHDHERFEPSHSIERFDFRSDAPYESYVEKEPVCPAPCSGLATLMRR